MIQEAARSDTPFERVLGRLESVKRKGDSATALCPNHGDDHQSLSITRAEDGKVLIYCFAGCSPDDVLGPIGMKMADLFPEGSNAPGRGKARIARVYPYHDETGAVLFEVVRMEPKDFRQRRPDGKGGHVWSLKGVRRVLYRLRELLQACEAGEIIFVCEGEKDADALAQLGLAATTNAGGAKAWGGHGYEESLRGARVVVLPDNDAAGEMHALEIAQSVFGIASEGRILRLPGLPGKGDVSDWLKDGGTKDELLRLAEAAPIWTPCEAAKRLIPALMTAAELRAKSFQPPREIIAGVRPEGLGVLAAKPKKGKSWLELLLAVAVASGVLALGRFATQAGAVLYLALEDSQARLQSRLRAILGAEAAWPEQLTFAHTWPRLDRGGLDALRAWLAGQSKPSMIVIDTFTRIRPAKDSRADSYQQDADATAALQRLALEYHVAIVLVLHQRKANADDVFDTISGTLGMTASADSIAVLTREHKTGVGKLSITGRDIEERELALVFDSGVWTCTGEAEPDESDTPREIAKDFLRASLASGPAASEPLIAEGKRRGISRNVIFEAKNDLRIRARKTGFKGGWEWALPFNLLNSSGCFDGEGDSSQKSTFRDGSGYLGSSDEESQASEGSEASEGYGASAGEPGELFALNGIEPSGGGYYSREDRA